MDRPYVEELHIQDYGCIRDATFRLTPLHALIGPNDSGKSTVLRALHTLSLLLHGSDMVERAPRAALWLARAHAVLPPKVALREEQPPRG